LYCSDSIASKLPNLPIDIGLLQWRSKGGKWGHAPWGECLGGATAHFLQSF